MLINLNVLSHVQNFIMKMDRPSNVHDAAKTVQNVLIMNNALHVSEVIKLMNQQEVVFQYVQMDTWMKMKIVLLVMKIVIHVNFLVNHLYVDNAALDIS